MTRRRKHRTHIRVDENSQENPPRSFVVRSGDVGKSVAQLVLDMRSVMQPNTATKLRERSSNKIRDFVSIAGPMHVSHLMIFTRPTEDRLTLRVGRLPRGPTISFSVPRFMLCTDVAAIVKRPKSLSGILLTSPPLLVLNNFPKDRIEYTLLATTLQHMFPALKVAELNLKTARRVVLFSYNPKDETVEFRHYAVDVKVAGITKGVKRLVSSKGLPDMHSYDDITEFIQKHSAMPDSDIEEVENENVVTIESKSKKKPDIMKTEKRSIRLTEIGPRMDLVLVKIQDNLCSGEILYHKFVQKSAEEVQNLRKTKEDAARLKQQRKKVQEQNVARKTAIKEERKRKRQSPEENARNQGGDDSDGNGNKDGDQDGCLFEEYNEDDSNV